MLRAIFGEPKRLEQGTLKQVIVLLQEAIDEYECLPGGMEEKGIRRLRLLTWTKSIAIAFDELEQSVYCSNMYGERVRHNHFDEMDEEERDNYRRHVYFYKNSFIRLFSVLDKLGSYMNERFALHTERMKDRYSYYTVLRRMRETRQHTELQVRLNEIKERYRESMQDLRSMRNNEVHSMNAELLDDSGKIRRSCDTREQIEDVRQNQQTLRDGFNMVTDSLQTVFHYIKNRR